MLDNMKNANK